MGSRLPQPHSSAHPPAVATPVKQIVSLQSDAGQYDNCPYGSPIGGLCTGPAAPSAASTARTKLHMGSASTARPKSVQPEPALTNSPASFVGRHGSGISAAARTGSMPEPWQAGSWPGRSAGRHLAADQQTQQQHVQQMRLSADNKPRRDQDLGQTSPALSPRSSYSGAQAVQQSTADSSPAHSFQSQSAQQPALLPLDVLLSPLLPSADEAKLVDRLSQLRHALDEHVRLAAGWEQQAVTLQAALSEVQEDSLQLRGQVASQQQHINLLGGNLQGRLSLVQGSVLAQMQEQVTQKDAALAASTQHVLAIQAELEKLSCSYAAKLAAEQAERQRLSAEAAQARLLCTARGRQVASLQQELQQMREAASQQQQTAAASTSVQQQQLESLRERLQDAQQQLETARFEVVEAQQVAAAAEGGRSGLRQQVEELQALLTEKQLQVEWLEGKVDDLEGSDISQQLRRHQAEVARLQETAAADHRALEQQLAAAHRQVAQLQQQDHTTQQALAQLEQQAQHLQQQLAQRTAESEELQQQLAQQAAVAEEQQQQLHEQEQRQHSGSAEAEAELAQQLSAADAELQQLRGQLAEAEDEIAALTQQLQQQERELHAHAQRDLRSFNAQEAGGLDDAGSADADGSQSPHVPAAELHALRAELGIANAEVARLRHQLDVAQASQQQERELTGHEIMRLQQELSEAAASGSGGAAAADAAGAEEVTSRLGTNRIGSDSSSSWHSVHDNPAFEHAQQQQQQQQRQQQDELQLLLCASGEEEEGSEHGHSELTGPAPQHNRQGDLADVPGAAAAPVVAANAAAAASKLARYESKLQDQADTISSLQRQLKQQEQLLVALQKRERTVYDSAASKGSWADTLGYEHQVHQLYLPAAAAAAGPAGSVVEPATPHTDAAVQTDLSGPAESAGSTAAAPAATASEDAAAAQTQWQQDQQASSRQQVVAEAGAAAGEAGASSALLAAARHEILRLQELNRQLMQAHAEELKASVSFEDARRAVSEAKQHAKAKAAAMLQSSNKTWADKLTAARAEAQQLHEQLQDLQQQRDQLAQQMSSLSQSHQAAVHQLQQELQSAQQHSQALSRQLQDMADSHMQELEQVRMEMEADAAAAMLDAAAASNRLSAQQQQRCTMRESAAQTDVPAAAAAVDAAAQTDSLPDSRQDEQHVARFARGFPQAQPTQQPQPGEQQHAADTISVQERQPPPQQQQQQQQQEEGDGYRLQSLADSRPGTPQPAAASPGAALGPNPDASAPPDAEPAAAQTPQQQRLASSWRSAAAAVAGGGTAADAGDDDICRFSSASDTPASASSRGPVSRFRGSLHAQGADGARPSSGQRPGSAEGGAGLPELTATSSPIAPSSLVKPPVRQTMQQQQQRRLAEQQQQQQQGTQLQQQLQQQPDKGPAQMSSWHAELLQQQAELEALRTRLSQQKEPAWKAAGPGSSSKSSPAVAHSRTLLLAPFAPALSDPVGGVGSPAGPVLSSSSPLTYQQRRAAAQQAAAAAAAAAPAAAVVPSSSRFTDGVSARSPQQLYSQQSAATAAEQLQFGQQQQQHGSAAAAAVGGNPDYTRWHSSSSPDGLTNSLLMGSPQPYPPSAGHATAAGADVLQPGSAPAGANSSWGLLLTATAARRSVSPVPGSSSGAALLGATPSQPGAAAGASTGSATTAAAAVGSSATAAGLSKLGDDVLGALSLSRYHRERSKLQEARAKQHALVASHHEDQAAALRNSRLGAHGGAGASAAAAGMSAGAVAGSAAGVSPRAGAAAWPGSYGGAGSRLL